MCRFIWNERNSRKLFWKPDSSPLLRPSCGHDVILKCFLLSLSETSDLSAVFLWALRWVQCSELCRNLTRKKLQVERTLRRDTCSHRDQTEVSACNVGVKIKCRVCKICQVLFINTQVIRIRISFFCPANRETFWQCHNRPYSARVSYVLCL